MDHLTMVLFGHAAFQHLNAGCELGLFELLAERPALTRDAIADALDLERRAADILLLGTTSLRLTTVTERRYSNSEAIKQVWDAREWQRFRDIVAFEARIVYEGQADYVASLQANTNVGLRRIPGGGRDLYHRFAENPELERVFYRYMRSWSELSNPALLDHVDFGRFRRVLDVGGGDAVNAIALAENYPDLSVTILEIPATAQIAERKIEERQLADRIAVHAGDMFADEYPTDHDCILFSHQLVIWTPEENVQLLRRAYDVLPAGGQVVIFNSISDDAGDGPLMAALDSVYFAALPAEGGMIYAWHQYEDWLREAGFEATERRLVRSWTPHGIVIGIKSGV